MLRLGQHVPKPAWASLLSSVTLQCSGHWELACLECRSTLPVCARWLQDRNSFTSPASTMPEAQHVNSERSDAGVQHRRAEQGGDLPSLLLSSLSLNGLCSCCEKPAKTLLTA